MAGPKEAALSAMAPSTKRRHSDGEVVGAELVGAPEAGSSLRHVLLQLAAHVLASSHVVGHSVE